MIDAGPLPIYVPDTHAEEGLCTMVEPLLHAGRAPSGGAIADYFRVAGTLFRRVPRSQSIVAVLPWNWDTACSDASLLRHAIRFIQDNAKAGIRTLIFHPHDSETPLRVPHTIVMRTSLVRGRHAAHEHAMPWLSEGFPELRDALPAPRPYRATPSIGFCGTLQREHYRTPTLYRRLFRRHRNQYPLAYPHAPGLRAIAVEHLRSTPGIECRFIERERFFGGAIRADGTLDSETRHRTRQEFLHNLLESDYALCMRGAGNFSIRFSEALSVGRVPLFVDSACVLPWPDLIDWDAAMVRVDIKDLPYLGIRLAAEHQRRGVEGFLRRQRLCVDIWSRFLSPPGFFKTLRDQLVAGKL